MKELHFDLSRSTKKLNVYKRHRQDNGLVFWLRILRNGEFGQTIKWRFFLYKLCLVTSIWKIPEGMHQLQSNHWRYPHYGVRVQRNQIGGSYIGYWEQTQSVQIWWHWYWKLPGKGTITDFVHIFMSGK